MMDKDEIIWGNRKLSFSESPNFFSYLSKKLYNHNANRFLKEAIRGSYDFVLKYVVFFPRLDKEIFRLYYFDNLSQLQISNLLEVSQVAVSRRLKYSIDKLRFLLKMPSLNPIQVREDFRIIFPESLFEFAYFFYWEITQNRVKFFISTSQSGASSKLNRILDHLQRNLDRNEKKENDIYYLTLIYFDYFKYIKDNPSILNYLCKKNDDLRSGAIVSGETIEI